MNRPAKLLNRKAAGYSSLITFAVLLIAWLAGFASRLFAVIRFESIIHEFDPWFNYRATAFMVEHGYYKFLNWFDERAWYPLGRIVGGTVYPGLMITSGGIHYILHALNIPVHIRDICVFLAPVFSGLTSISTYLLTKELWSPGAGLFAASFIAIVPGYISRSVAGSYDNEGIAIFALQFTYYLWVKSVKTGSVFWSSMAALSYFYMVSAWGGYVFIINLIPLHVFVLLLMGRYSPRLLTSYTTFYILGLLFSMQIPFVGFQPIRTSEHMAAMGVFVLLLAVGVLKHLQTILSKTEFKRLFIVGALVAAGVVFLAVVALTMMGVVAPWSGRFYSLWDTGYAKIHIPIIASVSEHQPTTWFSFFFDLHILVCAFPVGLWYCIKKINDERVFVVLYAISAVYFAGVMVRLMLTLTPVVCMLAGIAFSCLLEVFLKEDSSPNKATDETEETSVEKKNMYDKAGKLKHRPKHDSAHEGAAGIGANLKSVVILAILMLLMMFAVHCTWVTSNAYSSPSIVLAFHNSQDGSRNILDDFREAYYWLSQNTADDARIMSWWDYGYQIAGMANRTTLVDNNTWNNSHIALVGKAMSSTEEKSYEIMTSLDVDYVLVIFGGVIGYSGDDINKFLWMVRIAEGEHPKDIRESDYFTDRGEFRVDAEGAPALLNCLMYKLSYYRFGELKLDYRGPAGYDRTRNAVIGNKDFDLTYLEEAYTSEHWLVRIYRVKKPHEFNRPAIKTTDRAVSSGNYVSRKNSKRRKGYIKNRPVVVKGKRTRKSRNILDDFREAYYWLSQNTADDARIMSWWDYGYQIAGMANRTTLVDNNTWNNSHIALVGKAMSSTEEKSYEIMTSLDVDYVLVIFGGVIGYSGDDINKFLWMVRIAEGEHPKDIRESDYFTDRGEFRVDAEGAPALLNCLMYKLSYYRFGELKLDYRGPAGYDRTRNAVIGNKDFDLTYLEEAYTSEHWLVRIYRVKKPHEFNRPAIKTTDRAVSSGNYVSRKNSKRRKGYIKNRPVVVKGKRTRK